MLTKNISSGNIHFPGVEFRSTPLKEELAIIGQLKWKKSDTKWKILPTL